MTNRPEAERGRDTKDAERALPYAQLLRSLEVQGAPLPHGWQAGFDRRAFGPVLRCRAVLADFRAAAFVNAAERTVAIAIPGTRVNLRGSLGVVHRRVFGGASRLAMALVGLVRTELRDHAVTIVGHSSGGGIASHVGAALGLPSITFNGARTRAALLNNGDRQLNVIVRGDFWGDPNVLPGRLAGRTLWLDGEGAGPRGRHSMSTIVERLEGLVGSARTPTEHPPTRGARRTTDSSDEAV
ncbi:MAG: hypothetical protein KIS68_10180 [Bauldia sp.]|nr:hypothetical protein [Bauldia sp.]